MSVLCPAETAFHVHWSAAAEGVLQEGECYTGFHGTISRECLVGGTWGNITGSCDVCNFNDACTNDDGVCISHGLIVDPDVGCTFTEWADSVDGAEHSFECVFPFTDNGQTEYTCAYSPFQYYGSGWYCYSEADATSPTAVVGSCAEYEAIGENQCPLPVVLRHDWPTMDDVLNPSCVAPVSRVTDDPYIHDSFGPSVDAGIPCHFPFVFDGQLQYSCITVNTDADFNYEGHGWCSTTPIMGDSWGPCAAYAGACPDNCASCDFASVDSDDVVCDENGCDEGFFQLLPSRECLPASTSTACVFSENVVDAGATFSATVTGVGLNAEDLFRVIPGVNHNCNIESYPDAISAPVISGDGTTAEVDIVLPQAGWWSLCYRTYQPNVNWQHYGWVQARGAPIESDS